MAKAKPQQTLAQVQSAEINPFQAGRLKACIKWPYFSTGLWNLTPVQKEGLKELAGGFMGCDKYWRCYYDPIEIQQYNVEQIATALVHEVAAHLLRFHHRRFEPLLKLAEQQGLNLKTITTLCNLAGDAEGNDDINSDGAQWPYDPVMPATLGECIGKPHLKCADGELMENYYQFLIDNIDQVHLQGGGGGEGSEDENGQPKGGPSTPNCGSAAHGQQQPWEDAKDHPDHPGIGEAQADIVRAQVAKDIQRHVQQKGRGTIPGDWERWADQLLNPTVPWERELRAAVRNCVAEASGIVNYSFKKRSRRAPASFYLPGFRKPMPKARVYIDTSGSVSGHGINRAVAETDGILRACGMADGLEVCSVDHFVHKAQKVFSAKKIVPVGGGGTDMTLCFEDAIASKSKPHFVIIITDGGTPWPTANPGQFKTIIVLCEGAQTAPQCPSWAKVIIVD